MKMITGNEPAMPTEVSMDGDGLNATHHQVGNTTALFHGLTIRQHFAAMAMQGLCANRDWTDKLDYNEWEDYVQRVTSGAINMADALIAELNNPLTP